MIPYSLFESFTSLLPEILKIYKVKISTEDQEYLCVCVYVCTYVSMCVHACVFVCV